MGSREERHRLNHDLVPLAALISRELWNKKMEKPTVRYGCAAQSKKGEDYFLMSTYSQRAPGYPSSPFSMFAIFDGHNSAATALYSRDHLLNYVLSAIPCGLGRDEWPHAFPRALVAGFVKTDKEFQRKGQTSGTTATFLIIDRWTVTVASIGDSCCILDTQGGAFSKLNHRLEENAEERVCVTANGGEVGRLSIFGITEVGDGSHSLLSRRFSYPYQVINPYIITLQGEALPRACVIVRCFMHYTQVLDRVLFMDFGFG